MQRIISEPVPRDGWGRPKIDGTAYTRASTLASTFDDGYNLGRWKARMTALGISRSPELIGLAATATEDDWALLNDVAERAMDRAGGSRGRDIGTTVHSVSEMLDYGESTAGISQEILADGKAYQRCCQELGLTPVLAEQFVVNKTLKAAGTFDRLLTDGDEYFIADLKTGGANKTAENAAKWSGLAWSIQTATYAWGRPWANGSYRKWDELGVRTPSKERALILFIPRGSGICFPIWIDIVVGRQAARLASKVRAIKSETVVLK